MVPSGIPWSRQCWTGSVSRCSIFFRWPMTLLTTMYILIDDTRWRIGQCAQSGLGISNEYWQIWNDEVSYRQFNVETKLEPRENRSLVKIEWRKRMKAGPNSLSSRDAAFPKTSGSSGGPGIRGLRDWLSDNGQYWSARGLPVEMKRLWTVGLPLS